MIRLYRAEWSTNCERDREDTELFHRLLDDHQQLGDDHPRLAAWIDRVDQRPRAY